MKVIQIRKSKCGNLIHSVKLLENKLQTASNKEQNDARAVFSEFPLFQTLMSVTCCGGWEFLMAGYAASFLLPIKHLPTERQLFTCQWESPRAECTSAITQLMGGKKRCFCNSSLLFFYHLPNGKMFICFSMSPSE